MVIASILMPGLLSGCGDRRFPVEGQVLYGDGSPYSGGGVVVMETAVGTKMIMKRAPISPDGTFCMAAGSAGGALAGTYRVRILPAADDDPEKPPPPLSYDKKFQSFETSGLEWVIGPQSSSRGIVIDLGRRPTRLTQ
jgi:hypothetical protein